MSSKQSTMSNPLSIPQPLIWRWWGAVLIYAAGLAGVALWLNQTPWGTEYLGRWVAIATAVAVFELGLLRRHLDHNHRPADKIILPTIGLGNTLTLIRGLFLAMLAGFIASPRPIDLLAWFPVILYTCSDILDGLDGFAARKTNHQTKLGETLDVEFDALGIGLVTLLTVWYGQLPWWYLSLALARYLFILGTWWRIQRGRPVYALSRSKYRRMLAGFQMGFMSVALWPVIPAVGATLGGLIFITPSLTLFWRDWLIVSGRLDPTSAAYQQRRQQILTLIVGWLPIPLRLVLLLTAVYVGMVPPNWQGPPHWIALFHSWRWVEPWATWAAIALAIVSAILIICIFLGIWTRWFAFALIFGSSVNYIAVLEATGTWGWSATILVICTLTLFFTDSGRYSLWKPDDGYMYVPLGSQTGE